MVLRQVLLIINSCKHSKRNIKYQIFGLVNNVVVLPTIIPINDDFRVQIIHLKATTIEYSFHVLSGVFPDNFSHTVISFIIV